MSREIKFRAWDVIDKRWFPLDQLSLRLSDSRVLGSSTYVCVYQGRALLEQFTGLLDKDGREIWEGDVVEITWTESRMPFANEPIPCDERGRPKSIDTERKETGYIKWGHAGWKILYPNWLSDESGLGPKRPNEIQLSWLGTWPSTMTAKVIGNIHEHPHLLT